MHGFKLPFTLISFLLSTCSNLATAQVAWTGNGTTNQYSEAANWQGNQLPTAIDHILIDLATTSLVQQDVDATVTSVSIENGDVTWSGSQTLSTTDAQNGLMIDNGGHLIVSGNAAISNNGWLKIGDTIGSLDNRMTVANGGRVDSHHGYVGWSLNSGAQVTVSDSQWNVSDQLAVGHDGDGQLYVANGGKVNVGGTAYIGANAAGSGTVLLQSTSAGSKAELTMNQAIIGFNSSANVQVRMDSIMTTNSTSYLAYQGDATSSIRLNGTRAVWNNNGDFNVGVNGTAVGLIDVYGGGVANISGDLNLGVGTNNYGGMNVYDFGQPSTRANIGGDLNIGVAGMGSVSLNNTTVDVGGMTTINSDSSMTVYGNGKFQSAGGILSDGDIRFRDQGTGTQFARVYGDLELTSNGSIVVSGSQPHTAYLYGDLKHNGTQVQVTTGNILGVYGTWSGESDFSGSGLVSFNGEVRPGNDDAAVVNFANNVTLGSQSHSFFEIGGTMMGQYDQLNIGGNAGLNGELTVDLIDGFALSENQEFLLINVAGNRYGAFDNLAESSIVGTYGGYDLLVSYQMGDGNDFGVYSALSAVPEPSSGCILAAVTLAGLACRRRR